MEAGIASHGTAKSFLIASNIRTRQMHQITECSLYKVLKAAHTDYLEEVLSFETWSEERTFQSPQFLVYDTINGTGDPLINPVIHGSQLLLVLSVTG